MKRFVVPLAVALCFLSAVSHHSTASAKDTWISIRTKNFYVIGNANDTTDWYARGDDGLFQIIFHEYIHLLVDNNLKNSSLNRSFL